MLRTGKPPHLIRNLASVLMAVIHIFFKPQKLRFLIHIIRIILSGVGHFKLLALFFIFSGHGIILLRQTVNKLTHLLKPCFLLSYERSGNKPFLVLPCRLQPGQLFGKPCGIIFFFCHLCPCHKKVLKKSVFPGLLAREHTAKIIDLGRKFI